MVRRVTCALGWDLGLNTGWAIVRWQRHPAKPVILACGNVDVRHEVGVSDRMLAWHQQVAHIARKCTERGVTGSCYEEIRRMQGQGARYILMQEGILNVTVPGFGVPVLGVNQSTLRAHAKLKPGKAMTWAGQAQSFFKNAGKLQSEDQCVAAYAAHWLMCNAEEA